jgi:hypothetical protein
VPCLQGLSDPADDADGVAASVRAGPAHSWRQAGSDASVDFKRKSRVLLLEMLRAKVFVRPRTWAWCRLCYMYEVTPAHAAK